eukprot:COSAG05_NODE_731_length_7667_cov_140.831792_6_plen_188_part_00
MGYAYREIMLQREVEELLAHRARIIGAARRAMRLCLTATGRQQQQHQGASGRSTAARGGSLLLMIHTRRCAPVLPPPFDAYPGFHLYVWLFCNSLLLYIPQWLVFGYTRTGGDSSGGGKQLILIGADEGAACQHGGGDGLSTIQRIHAMLEKYESVAEVAEADESYRLDFGLFSACAGGLFGVSVWV